MNWVPTQGTLNLSPTFVPKTITDFFCHLSTIPNATQKLSMLEDFTASLQHELAKIDPLKRELPFCMQLLNDAISTLKTASDRYRAHKSEAVLNKECDKNQNYELNNKNNEKERQCEDEKEKEDSVITSRALSSSLEKKTDRKLWKSWTPELHRKFLEALEVLGGSEVATPKQIRAVMKVDGLTNDEVKSYLQKYRLHTRRVPPANLSVEVPEGLWIYSNFSKDSSSDSDSGSGSSSGSPQGPFQLTTESGEGTSTTNMEEDEELIIERGFADKSFTTA